MKESRSMKKCSFCAEDIQDEAIKCKHCGEWLKKGEIGFSDVERPDETPTIRFEKINKIFRQTNAFVDISDIPDLIAHLPQEYLETPRNINVPEIMDARTYAYKGLRRIRYSNLQFKGWGIYDVVFTNERIVLVGIIPRRKLAPLDWFGFGLVGIAVATALEKYQQLTKDKTIDLNVIEDLVESGAAIHANIGDIEKIVVASEKLSFVEAIGLGFGDVQSRIIIKGKFSYSNKKLKGFIGFGSGQSKKDTKKSIDKIIRTKVIALDTKVDVNSDYRDTLKNADESG